MERHTGVAVDIGRSVFEVAASPSRQRRCAPHSLDPPFAPWPRARTLRRPSLRRLRRCRHVTGAEGGNDELRSLFS